jgi:hypothetical protein
MKGNYKPRVVLGDFTIKYFPRKYKDFLLSKEPSKKKLAMESIKSVRAKNRSIPLNNKDQYPNEDIMKSHVGRLFTEIKVKFDWDENIYLLRDVKVKSETTSTYYV